MKKLLLVSCLLFVGCKGKQGPIGPVGPTQVQDFSVVVTSNDMIVIDPRFVNATGVLTYNSNFAQFVEMPYYLPTPGVNTFAVFTPAQGKIELFNCQLAGATKVIITIIY